MTKCSSEPAVTELACDEEARRTLASLGFRPDFEWSVVDVPTLGPRRYYSASIHPDRSEAMVWLSRAGAAALALGGRAELLIYDDGAVRVGVTIYRALTVDEVEEEEHKRGLRPVSEVIS